ncbi:MAG: hypothetical protein Q4C47_00690, partial [Planctomycetia bacterium]|nr:hypothetical protein [Planctomycetia bacterium]
MRRCFPCFLFLMFQVALIQALTPISVHAYNPPTDTAGSLLFRIEAPETIEHPETPTPIRVIVENRGEVKLDGTFSVKLIDRWIASPDGVQRFSVDAKSSQTFGFTLTAEAPTYNAHYPIHVLARWSEPSSEDNASPEVEYTAHPIAIFIVRADRPPMAGLPEIPWLASVPGENSRIAISELPSVRIGFGQYTKEDGAMSLRSTGWFGDDPDHRGFVKREPISLEGGSLDSFVSHIPWTGGPGYSLVEIPLSLAVCEPITLDFANGVRRPLEGNGDGMTFVVRALPLDAPAGTIGPELWSDHLKETGIWKHASVDLSRFAGQSIRLQLEWNPGPDRNTSFDLGYWGAPILTCGTPPSTTSDASGTSVETSAST